MKVKNVELPIEAIKALCEQYGVRELAIFGSAVRDDFSSDSDVDLLVEFAPDAEIGFLAFARLQRELSALLGLQVDLVPKNGLKPTIRDAILASAEVVYAA